MLAKNAAMPRIDDLSEVSVEYFSDHLIFYGQGPNVWTYDSINKIFKHQQNKFSNYTYYYITDLTGASKPINTIPTPENGSQVEVNTFDAYQYIEPDIVNLLRSGAEWYSEPISNGNSYLYNFNFPNTDISSSAKFYYDVIG